MNRHLLVVLLLIQAGPAEASPLSGIGRAIDGDSLMVGNQEVRLFGIDAPEATQSCTRAAGDWACGKKAAEVLAQLVNGKQVSCTSLGVDKHGRTLGQCTAGTSDVNRSMVLTGYAIAFRRYSMAYISAEESAKAWKRGLWSGTFVAPSEFRQAAGDHDPVIPVTDRQSASKRSSVSRSASKPQPSSACRIKGNHSRKGEWIYHLPGMPYYEQTRAEQMFCTEAEARAAGYRRSRADRRQ